MFQTFSLHKSLAVVWALQNLGFSYASFEDELRAGRSLSIGYVLYPGFEPLDVYGPLEILYAMSEVYNMTLSTIASQEGPVSARAPPRIATPEFPEFSPYSFDHMIGPSTVATHTFKTAPPLDVIIVPGGRGDAAIIQTKDSSISDFLNQRLDSAQYILSVCTGSGFLGRAGLLKGKRATTNKYAWPFITDEKWGKDIKWVPSARWVEDGKIWTSSGVAAGLDMMYAFMKHLYGTEMLNMVLNTLEYVPHQDAHWDPFSVVWKVPGAETNRSLADCAAPVES
ncbi:class I glutamine amidotransferase-like protein [Amniculicola lignicola CBS 123094]|uniref:Class I glutamine amidotransferase-like protein n=1 Tax=Amniculicola lignicola CBS 123094 TaxID=1392246 RepID=A0A6A5WK81_9PLEO|nr:class I glutamine amidotransferase-like protein [Amniculicola lignicola CBS 123094]